MIVTSRSGAAQRACRAHINPAPPLPITATSVVMVSTSSGLATIQPLQPPAAQAADRAGRVEALRADGRAGVDVAATPGAVVAGDGPQAFRADSVAAVGDQDHRPVEGGRTEEVAPVGRDPAAGVAGTAGDAIEGRVDDPALRRV